MNEKIIEKLFSIYTEKGFLTNDDILNELIVSKISLVQTERICSELLLRGVLISDEKSNSNNTILSQKSNYDKAQIDYDKLFDEITSKEPSLVFLLDYIRKIKPPQLHEVENLYSQIKCGNLYARKRLFEMNMRNVIRLSYQKSKQFNLSLVDTIQDGLEGLLVAIDKFDLSKHDKFQGYSTFWILNYINRSKNINDSLITLPAHYLEKYEKIFKYLKKYRVDFFYDGKITKSLIDEIFYYFNFPREDIEKSLKLLRPYEDISKIMEEAFDSSVLDEIDNSMLHDLIESVLSTLPPREKLILKLRLGLYSELDNDFAEIQLLITDKIYKNIGNYNYGLSLTLEEIASLVGVSRERIRQIEAKALRRLRHPKRSKRLKKYFK